MPDAVTSCVSAVIPDPPEPVHVTAPVVGEHETVPAPVTDETAEAGTAIDSTPVLVLKPHVAPVHDTALTNDFT